MQGVTVSVCKVGTRHKVFSSAFQPFSSSKKKKKKSTRTKVLGHQTPGFLTLKSYLELSFQPHSYSKDNLNPAVIQSNYLMIPEF